MTRRLREVSVRRARTFALKPTADHRSIAPRPTANPGPGTMNHMPVSVRDTVGIMRSVVTHTAASTRLEPRATYAHRRYAWYFSISESWKIIAHDAVAGIRATPRRYAAVAATIDTIDTASAWPSTYTASPVA